MFKDHTNGKIKSYPNLLLHVDGGCMPKNPGGTTASGWVLYDEQKNILAEEGKVVQQGGPLSTNNYGEYMALVLALEWLTSQKWKGTLTIKADSKLLIEQVSEKWKVKAAHLATLRTKIFELMDELSLHRISEDSPIEPTGKNPCYLMWIRREYNAHADSLCHIAYNEARSSE